MLPLLHLFFALAAGAGSPGQWLALHERCDGWVFADPLSGFLQSATGWDQGVDGTIQKTGVFSRTTCPNYVNRANAGHSVGSNGKGVEEITLAEFVTAQQELARAAAESSHRADQLSLWLATEYEHFAKAHAELGYDPLKQGCLQNLRLAHEFVALRKKELEAAVRKIEEECPAGAAALARLKRVPASNASPGKSAPELKSAMHQPPRRSTITGVEESRAKTVKMPK